MRSLWPVDCPPERAASPDGAVSHGTQLCHGGMRVIPPWLCCVSRPQDFMLKDNSVYKKTIPGSLIAQGLSGLNNAKLIYYLKYSKYI